MWILTKNHNFSGSMCVYMCVWKGKELGEGGRREEEFIGVGEGGGDLEYGEIYILWFQLFSWILYSASTRCFSIC